MALELPVYRTAWARPYIGPETGKSSMAATDEEQSALIPDWYLEEGSGGVSSNKAYDEASWCFGEVSSREGDKEIILMHQKVSNGGDLGLRRMNSLVVFDWGCLRRACDKTELAYVVASNPSPKDSLANSKLIRMAGDVAT